VQVFIQAHSGLDEGLAALLNGVGRGEISLYYSYTYISCDANGTVVVVQSDEEPHIKNEQNPCSH